MRYDKVVESNLRLNQTGRSKIGHERVGKIMKGETK